LTIFDENTIESKFENEKIEKNEKNLKRMTLKPPKIEYNFSEFLSKTPPD